MENWNDLSMGERKINWKSCLGEDIFGRKLKASKVSRMEIKFPLKAQAVNCTF